MASKQAPLSDRIDPKLVRQPFFAEMIDHFNRVMESEFSVRPIDRREHYDLSFQDEFTPAGAHRHRVVLDTEAHGFNFTVTLRPWKRTDQLEILARTPAACIDTMDSLAYLNKAIERIRMNELKGFSVYTDKRRVIEHKREVTREYKYIQKITMLSLGMTGLSLSVAESDKQSELKSYNHHQYYVATREATNDLWRELLWALVYVADDAKIPGHVQNLNRVIDPTVLVTAQHANVPFRLPEGKEILRPFTSLRYGYAGMTGNYEVMSCPWRPQLGRAEIGQASFYYRDHQLHGREICNNCTNQLACINTDFAEPEHQVRIPVSVFPPKS